MITLSSYAPLPRCGLLPAHLLQIAKRNVDKTVIRKMSIQNNDIAKQIIPVLSMLQKFTYIYLDLKHMVPVSARKDSHEFHVLMVPITTAHVPSLLTSILSCITS
jgi:hypothetical protein